MRILIFSPIVEVDPVKTANCFKIGETHHVSLFKKLISRGRLIRKHSMQPGNALSNPFSSSWRGGAAKALTALSLAGGIVRQEKLTSNEIKADLAENPQNLSNQDVFAPPQGKTYSANRAHMILIEGLDLAGKSTLTQSLVAHLQKQGHPVSYSRNALVPDNPIALVADEYRRNQPVSLLETGALFLAAHLKDAIDFKKPEKGFHIQDSSWLRTLAFNELQEVRWIPALVKDSSKHQPVFDLVIYLTASTETRQQRVLKREQEQPGEMTALIIGLSNILKNLSSLISYFMNLP